MSSLSVRNQVKTFLGDNSAEIVVDLSGQFADFREMLAQEEIQPDSPWLGLDFLGNDETPQSLTANNEQGLYREVGLIILHVCAEAKLGSGQSILTRGEALRNLFRGRRIGSIVIESVAPVNFGPGATLEFDSGYISGTINITYHADSTPSP